VNSSNDSQTPNATPIFGPVKIEITSDECSAKNSKLRTTWSLEAKQDLISVHSIAAEDAILGNTWKKKKAELLERLADPECDPDTWPESTDKIDFEILLEEQMNGKSYSDQEYHEQALSRRMLPKMKEEIDRLIVDKILGEVNIAKEHTGEE